jgi:hypothetical protein
VKPFSEIYGNETFPFKISVFVENEVLKVQTSGQPAYSPIPHTGS